MVSLVLTESQFTGMKRVLLAGCLGRAAAAACSCKPAWSWGYCSDQAGCPPTACDSWPTNWCEVEPAGCDGSTDDGIIHWMECDQSTPVGSSAPTASPAPTVAPSTAAPSASPAPTVDVPAMTDWGSATARCFSTLSYYIGQAPTLAACWATCYATFGLELVAVAVDTDNYCYCHNDCMCMNPDSWGWIYHTATLASVSALPGACGDAPGEGDGCHCLDCADAIDGGVCYPDKIGKLNPVYQDQGDGTFTVDITTICPDLDPSALCADAAPKAQFIAPAALAAALLLSL